MRIQAEIETTLRRDFDPVHLDVVNESHKHNVPPGSESHFKVTMASAAFEGKAPLARHRLINNALAGPLAAGVHALSLKLYTPAQWIDAGGEIHTTPPCSNKKPTAMDPASSR